MTVTFGLETFLTFTQFFSVLLAIGHLYYLLAIIASKSLVSLLVIGAMPLQKEDEDQAADFSNLSYKTRPTDFLCLAFAPHPHQPLLPPPPPRALIMGINFKPEPPPPGPGPSPPSTVGQP
jgi:hypothetical protein